MGDAPLKRAVALMTVTSALAPVIGIVSAPLLTHGLGVDGRGALSVASAPNILLSGVVTFGLPEAITFYTARSPRVTGRALRWSALITLALCGAGVVVIVALAPILTGGRSELVPLIVVGALLAAPLLLMSLVRGAAAGLQMWGAIAIERVLSAVFRLALVLGLTVSGSLTVFSALLATTAGPIIGVLAYVGVARAARQSAAAVGVLERVPLTEVFRYGAHTWFGAVAGILLSRINQIMFAPLSTVGQLGLYVVAVTISDVPLITAIAIRDALFGVNSKKNDVTTFAATTRTTIFVAVLGSGALAASLPFWIAPIFGGGFGAATTATQLLLLSTVLNVPAFLAAAGLAAWGRPALRSAGLVVTLVVNIALFVVLVPAAGAIGAAAAAAASAGVSAIFMVYHARQIMEVGARELLVVRRHDLVVLVDTAVGVARQSLRRPGRRT